MTPEAEPLLEQLRAARDPARLAAAVGVTRAVIERWRRDDDLNSFLAPWVKRQLEQELARPHHHRGRNR